jgi:hypothetical protein
MSPFTSTDIPEEENTGAKADANKQPARTKRVVHLPKQPSPDDERKAQFASVFRHKGAPPTETADTPETSPAGNTGTGASGLKPNRYPATYEKSVPSQNGKGSNPGLRLRALETAGKNSQPPDSLKRKGLSFIRSQGNRDFLNILVILSLVINAILIVFLVITAIQLRNAKTAMNGILSGLYEHLADLGKTNITSTVMVETQVPLDFMLPIQQDSEVILTQNVAIPNAHIVINSGGLTINSTANITLPAGTSLPIALNLSVPVQHSIPVSLQVPIYIPLSQTELHAPLDGLQESLRTYLCNYNKDARDSQGVNICEDQGVPASTPGAP